MLPRAEDLPWSSEVRCGEPPTQKAIMKPIDSALPLVYCSSLRLFDGPLGKSAVVGKKETIKHRGESTGYFSWCLSSRLAIGVSQRWGTD